MTLIATPAAGITFTVVVDGLPDTYQYDWNSPDGVFRNVVQSSSTPVTSHVYTAAGSYRPVLRIVKGAESVDKADQNTLSLNVMRSTRKAFNR